MKKLLLVFGVLLLSLGLAACGESKKDNDPPKENASKAKKADNVAKDYKFGKYYEIGNEQFKVEFKVNSVKRLDKNSDDVVDLSSNYSNLKDFVLVDYTYKALTDVDDATLDGSNFTFIDSTGQVGMESSNRGMVIKPIKAGQVMHTQIGVGFENKGNDIKIQIGKVTFSGKIKNK